MEATDERSQSTLGVIGKIVLAAVIMGAIRAAAKSSGVEVVWDPEAFLSGAFLGLLQVSFDYRRLPASRRLAPLPTVALGLGSLAIMGVVLASAPRPLTEVDWIGWLALPVMVAAPLYLLVAGVRALGRERRMIA